MIKLILLLSVYLTHSPFAFSQSCSSELDASLSLLPNWLTDKREENAQLVNQKCITAAMDIYYSWTESVAKKRKSKSQETKGQFSYCNNENSSTPTRSELPVCKTDTYINVVQNSYNDVMECFDLDPKLFFPMIALESGFHLNSLSIVGEDFGIGQMTSIAVEHVNSKWTAMFDQIILKSNKKSCKRILEIISVNDISNETDQNICSLSTLPKNPIKNLVYMGFLTSMNRIHIKNYLKQGKVTDRISSLIGADLTDTEIDKIINTLTFLSYNQGSLIALKSLESFLDEISQNINLLTAELEELRASKASFYLIAMAFKADNNTDSFNFSMQTHSDILKKIEEIKKSLQEKPLSLSQLLINDQDGGFGVFLIKNNISPYLSYLKERSTYIEKSLNQPSGFCSTHDYLDM